MGYDHVDVVQSGLFDAFLQSGMEVFVGLDAVDLGDFGGVVARELVSASGPKFKYDA